VAPMEVYTSTIYFEMKHYGYSLQCSANYDCMVSFHVLDDTVGPFETIVVACSFQALLV